MVYSRDACFAYHVRSRSESRALFGKFLPFEEFEKQPLVRNAAIRTGKPYFYPDGDGNFLPPVLTPFKLCGFRSHFLLISCEQG